MNLDEFWVKYAQHKKLIDRCFHYLLSSRFPNPEGEQDAYSTLLMRMYELDVFNKFNPKRIVAQRKGICKNQANDAVADSEVSDENLQKLGIDIEKKFEQFVFKYIEHILQEAYMQRKKQSQRFLHCGSLSECRLKPRQLVSFMNDSKWAQGEEQLAELEKHLEKKAANKNFRVYPTYDESADYVGSKEDNALDSILANEITRKFREILHNDSERKVYDMTLEGISNTDIASSLDCTPQNVNIILQKIRKKYERFMEKTNVPA
jgi:hypothetical protein